MSCIIGVSFKDKAFILDVEKEVSLDETGSAIIHWLNRDKTSFVSEIFKFQKEGTVKTVLLDKIIPSENIELDIEFNEISILELERNINSVEFVYIYNVDNDLLMIKTPELPELLALTYNCLDDVELYFEEHNLEFK